MPAQLQAEPTCKPLCCPQGELSSPAFLISNPCGSSCTKLCAVCCRAGTPTEHVQKGREDGSHVFEAGAFEDSTTAALPSASSRPHGDRDGAPEGADTRSLKPLFQRDQTRVLDGAATQSAGVWSPGDPASLEDGAGPHRSADGEASTQLRPTASFFQSLWGNPARSVGAMPSEGGSGTGQRHVEAGGEALGFEGAAFSGADTEETFGEGAVASSVGAFAFAFVFAWGICICICWGHLHLHLQREGPALRRI